jgi:excisionase family DNA binding protein
MLSNLIRSSDVASILGISKALAYRLLAEGAIPSIRFGRTVRCLPEDLEKFISAHMNNVPATLLGNNGGSHE